MACMSYLEFKNIFFPRARVPIVEILAHVKAHSMHVVVYGVDELVTFLEIGFTDGYVVIPTQNNEGIFP